MLRLFHSLILLSLLSLFGCSIGVLCPCDEIPTVCDSMCCCDRSCAPEELNSFGRCSSLNKKMQDKCIDRTILFHNNSLFPSNFAQEKMRCFLEKNYPESDFFQVPQLATTINDTDLLSKTFTVDGGAVKIESCRNLSKETEIFKAGNPIMVYFESGLLGSFQLPMNQDTGVCHSIFEPKILTNASSTCTRILRADDGGSSCTTLPSIDQYTTGFQFVQYFENITIFNSTGCNESMNMTKHSAFLLPINSTKCFSMDGQSRSCPTSNPVYDSTSKTCSDITKEIYFNFAVSTIGLVDVAVQAIVADGLTDNFVQKFHVHFTENLTIPDKLMRLAPPPEAYMSGSPGYILGAPVRSGIRNAASIQLTPPIPISFGTNWEEQVGTWTHGWWPVFAGGRCQTQIRPKSQIHIIRFGIPMQSSCLLHYRQNVSGNGQLSVCQALQNDIVTFLDKPYNATGPIPTHVSRWGNSSTQNSTAWVAVNTTQRSSTPTLSAGLRSCHNIITGQTLMFVFAKRGRVYEPQNEILAVYKTYHRGTISFKCGGRYCTANNADLEQTKPIRTVVRFRDISLPPNWPLDRVPTGEMARSAGDLYYPFKVESEASWPAE